MSILRELYAQGGDDVILHTLELTCTAWEEPLVLVRDFADHDIVTEDGREIKAIATGMSIALPRRDNTAAQKLTFALDGVRQDATILLRQAISSQRKVTLTYRVYVSSNLAAPADRPFFFEVHGVKATADRVEITAGIFDFIDMKWPREVFDSRNAPGLRFME